LSSPHLQRVFKGIYKDTPAIIKERFKKEYRIAVLDEKINKHRLAVESRALKRVFDLGVKVPRVLHVDMVQKRIYMEYIDGITLKEYLIQFHSKIEGEKEMKDEIRASFKLLATTIGSNIAKMHISARLVHGDLTTSNMMLRGIANDGNLIMQDIPLYFIDFGLCYTTTQLEDRAVDLYVLERAIQSTHAQLGEGFFNHILDGYFAEYTNQVEKASFKTRYESVRSRGRKRIAFG
jgi:TP53 regulating kinase and related kinases